MHADDVLIYLTMNDVNTCTLLTRAVESLSLWLATTSLSISIPKFQVCIFTTSRVKDDDISLNLAGTLVTCGASPFLLLTVHKGLVRACLEWGATLLLNASISALGLLDRIEYESLRAALGYMRRLPVLSDRAKNSGFRVNPDYVKPISAYDSVTAFSCA